MDDFRSALGGLNGNDPGSVGSGRREINWDGALDSLSSPDPFPSDFFNANPAGRARGAVFTAPGAGFQVSAGSSNPTSTAVEFGDLDPGHPGVFSAFSAERLFTAVGGNVLDVGFFVPGST